LKLLLDENLPRGLRLEITGHEVFTTAYMKWSGIENGELLRRAADAGFDALLTTDRGLEYEQNVATLPLAVVVLLVKPNTIETIRCLLPGLHEVLTRLSPRTLVKVMP
jgi:hypothetical protein